MDAAAYAGHCVRGPACAGAARMRRYHVPMPWIDALLAATGLTLALVLRPWRAVPAGGLPWPWLAWCAAMPALWAADRASTAALAPSLSGSCLLVLMAGWPLALLGLAPVALLTVALAGLPVDQALHRLVWLGIVPATLAFVLGAAIRRWLPRQLFVYILGRAFLATGVAGSVSGGVAVALDAAPIGSTPLDLMVARGLMAWGDAFLTGMFAAIFVAFRPHWLATYADRIYLPAAQTRGSARQRTGDRGWRD